MAPVGPNKKKPERKTTTGFVPQGGRDSWQDNTTEAGTASDESKDFPFVLIDEERIYFRRKYVKRDAKRWGVDHDDNEAGSRGRSKRSQLAVEPRNTRILENPNSPKPELRGWQFDVFWDSPMNLTAKDMKDLWNLANRGFRCPLLRKWFYASLHDDCVVHCLTLTAAAVWYRPAINSAERVAIPDAGLLPYKIRAIRATNELIQDPERNTTDLVLLAVGFLAAHERVMGGEDAVLRHAKGYRSILDHRKAHRGHLDDCCPILMRGANATFAIATLRQDFHESNLLPVDDSSSIAAHTDHLLQRYRASEASLIRFSTTTICQSGTLFYEHLKRLEKMLMAIQAQANAGIDSGEFTDCSEMLDDLWTSRSTFTNAADTDPATSGVAKGSWVGAMSTILWISKVSGNPFPEDLSNTKKLMIELLTHPSVTQLVSFPLSCIREWAELGVKIVHLAFRGDRGAQ